MYSWILYGYYDTHVQTSVSLRRWTESLPSLYVPSMENAFSLKLRAAPITQRFTRTRYLVLEANQDQNLHLLFSTLTLVINRLMFDTQTLGSLFWQRFLVLIQRRQAARVPLRGCNHELQLVVLRTIKNQQNMNLRNARVQKVQPGWVVQVVVLVQLWLAGVSIECGGAY